MSRSILWFNIVVPAVDDKLLSIQTQLQTCMYSIIQICNNSCISIHANIDLGNFKQDVHQTTRVSLGEGIRWNREGNSS